MTFFPWNREAIGRAICVQIIVTLWTGMLFAQIASFSSIPQHLQLYPRDSQDSAVVEISGTLISLGYDSVFVEIDKNNVPWRRVSAPAVHAPDCGGIFLLRPKIHAELSNYQFRVYARSGSSTDLLASRDSVVCGDVFMITGQSNANWGFDNANYSNSFCRSFGFMADGQTYDLADTTWGISTALYAASQPGYFRVGVWGMYFQRLTLERYGIPSCVINGGAGGTDIDFHLRDDANPEDLSTSYGQMLYRARKAGLRDHVKLFAWHQGESNTSQHNWSDYQQKFGQLRNAWKQDYPALQKVYAFQLSPMHCGGIDYQQQLREIQRTLGDVFPDVEVMSSSGVEFFQGCHYFAAGYENMGHWMYRLIERDFYGRTDLQYITPPQIQQVYYTDSNRDEIAMVFDHDVNWPADTTVNGITASMKDYIFLDGNHGAVVSGSANGNTILLQLSGTTQAGVLTYLPNYEYHNSSELYRGPWIRNPRGVSALAFFEFPIASGPGGDNGLGKNEGGAANLGQNMPNPFNATTVFRFDLTEPMPVKIVIYDLVGREVDRLNLGRLAIGEHRVSYDAQHLPSGVYVYRLAGLGLSMARRMLIIK